ncbi:hypothetical protein [Rahnella perminowiae]|uniref:hypothetical protein n=1 Tax=Rahnella perminowiae TaxID=2816244 RepID=UPI00215CEEF0|nr:hypothetical protein [Rahnella perminowiae]MCR9001141.1 hypothetical protein [Rahnella perminowiae]
MSDVEVDDPSQPAYQAAFTVKGLSGVLPLHCFEGIVFNGNSNTVAIKLIGCCGVKPHAVFFVITVMVLYLIMVPPREPGWLCNSIGVRKSRSGNGMSISFSATYTTITITLSKAVIDDLKISRILLNQ